MIDFLLEIQDPHRHQVLITCSFTPNSEIHTIQIPYWRPGRYEGGNFPRNYINMVATSGSKNIPLTKTTSHTWLVHTTPGQSVELKYSCNAAELTAGNTFLDSSFLLINPVNCLVYPLGMESSEMRLSLALPDDWKAATSFDEDDSKENGDLKAYRVKDLQELLDTPILASRELYSTKYHVDGIDFHVHSHGERAFDETRLLEDFRAFTEVQVRSFEGLPVSEYHFLLIFTPYRSYHGVEHEKSTVIILGPSAEIGDWTLYRDLLGVSSHELYHTWNVKYLRPKSWAPYDFTGPGHERLAYIAEGVTTYMGDWMLWQSGVFNDEQYFEELAGQVQKHMDNEGRLYLSLGDAAIDTWTDGYGRGAPRRRISIYTEGALLAFVTDVWLQKESKGERGLAEFMKDFCAKYGGAQGYTEENWWEALADGSDMDWTALRSDLVDGKDQFRKYVNDALDYLGLALKSKDSEKYWERSWGAVIESVGGQWIVLNLALGAPAEQGGLWFGDEVLSVDREEAQDFFTRKDGWSDGARSMKVRFAGAERTVQITRNDASYFQKLGIEHKTTGELSEPFLSWKHLLSKHLAKK